MTMFLHHGIFERGMEMASLKIKIWASCQIRQDVR